MKPTRQVRQRRVKVFAAVIGGSATVAMGALSVALHKGTGAANIRWRRDGPTDFGTEGFGLSTAGGSGGRPTGSTEPILPQFGGTPSSNAVLENSGSGALAHGNVGGEQSVLGPSICVGC